MISVSYAVSNQADDDDGEADSYYLCPPGESSSDAGTQAGVHRLVESLYGLQGERSKLRGELRLMHSQLEQKEKDRHSRIQAFHQQVGSCILI